jgi:hypothetical protein
MNNGDNNDEPQPPTPTTNDDKDPRRVSGNLFFLS